MIIHLLAAVAALTGAPKTPHTIVQSLYAPYLADPQAKSGNKVPDSETQVEHYATPGLARLIHADEHCDKHARVCGLDEDFLIAGQDWDLSRSSITDEPPAANAQVIRAAFVNGRRVEVNFFFQRQGGAWKIDDIEDVVYKADGQVETRYWMKKDLQAQ